MNPHIPHIPQRAVRSSNLKSVGYDDRTGTLDVTFHSGETYRYANIPPATYSALVSAKSVGKAFHSLVQSKRKGVKV